MSGPFFAANLAALESRLPALAALLRAAAEGQASADQAGPSAAAAGTDAVGADGAGAADAGAGTAIPAAPRLPLLEILPPPGNGAARPCPWPSARLDGRLLHSAYDPKGEAARLAASLPAEADCAVLFGFGLGFLAESLLSRSEGGKVLACEAEPGQLAALLGARDLSAILADERLAFLVGGPAGGLLAALDELGCRKPALIGLRAAELAWPDWYQELREALGRFSSKEEINRNTLRRFGRLWVSNLARNLRLIGELPGTGRLAGLFSGLPCLVVAAGPSLDRILPLLPELRRRCLVVCVDTALRSVLRSGIEPDFLVVVDPQYWNWRHLEGLSSPSSILISESAAWPACFRFACRATFLCSSLFPLGTAIERRVGEKGRLGAGGSVATTAWDFARVLGAAPVYMAGLDLGFPEGKTHAEASLFEQRALQAGRRLAPAETSQAAALLGGGALWGKARDGAPIRTDKRMSLYAWWFESRLARADSPRTHAIGSEGLAIPGMEAVRIEELLDLPDIRKRLDELLVLAAAMREKEGAPAMVETGLGQLRAELARAAALAEAAAAEAEAARRDLAAGRDPAARFAFLDKADARLVGGGANDIIGFLMPDLDAVISGKASSLDESLSRSAVLYRGVSESAKRHLEALSGS